MSAQSQALRHKLMRCKGMHIELPVAELLELVADVERMEQEVDELWHELGLTDDAPELDTLDLPPFPDDDPAR